MAKISVIVPIYGVEKYLKECVDSILTQTLSDIEIILIDDGSKDNCPKIIDEYAEQDSRIIAIHKENGGYGQTCNIGLKRATGEYIAIVEPDDYIDCKMYEDLYKIAHEFNSDIVKSCFYDNLQSKMLKGCNKVKWDDDKIPQNKSFTIKECPLFLYYHPSIWSCIYKREFLNKHNICFVEAPGAGWTDNPFQVQTMCLAERINYTPNAYYYWRRLNEYASDDLKDCTIPYLRTNEIHKWLKENNINDKNILLQLSRRELAYIVIILGKKEKEILSHLHEIKQMILGISENDFLSSDLVRNDEKTTFKMVKNNLKFFRFKLLFKRYRKEFLSIRLNKTEKRIVFCKRILFEKRRKDFNRKIPVIFAINNGYVKQLSAAIVSILKNSDKSNCFEFNILNSDITCDNKEKIMSLKKINKNTTFNFIDMKQVVNNFDLEKYMSRRDDYKYISIETYFRFFIPDMFPEYKKVLYLDADILVLDDISNLFEEDIENYWAGAVQDTVLEVFIADKNIKTRTKPERIYKDYFKEKLGKHSNRYFNAGVLLLNLDKIRKDKMVEKLWNFTAKESPLEFQDQDVLNAVFESDVKYVDYKWNTLKDLNWFARQLHDKKKEKYLLETYRRPGIFHYVGSNKPWLVHKENYNYAFIEEWWKYYKLSPYFNKQELNILKNAKWMNKNTVWKHYITIRIGNFTVIESYREPELIKFKILNFIKTHIRIKKPKSLEKLKSI